MNDQTFILMNDQTFILMNDQDSVQLLCMHLSTTEQFGPKCNWTSHKCWVVSTDCIFMRRVGYNLQRTRGTNVWSRCVQKHCTDKSISLCN